VEDEPWKMPRKTVPSWLAFARRARRRLAQTTTPSNVSQLSTIR
jgi:hypothetical protein